MQAVVLAAGYGSRIKELGPSKPLIEVAGRALLHHVLSGLCEAAIKEAVVVLGHRAGDVKTAIAAWNLPLAIRTVEVANPSLPNGVSALAAAPLIEGRALLLMSDHIVEPRLYAMLASCRAEAGELLLGVDRRIGHAWIDEDDVTRVETRGSSIVSIGKGITPYNGYDTGVFSVDRGLFDALSAIDAPSLSQGVKILAAQQLGRAVETNDCAWIDVDDPRALKIAEGWLGHPQRKDV